jgi:hypothetical protein
MGARAGGSPGAPSRARRAAAGLRPGAGLHWPWESGPAWRRQPARLGPHLNCTRISARRALSALPALSRKGTPSQRGLLMNMAHAAKVGVIEPGGTVASSRYPGRVAPLAARLRYWPTTTSSVVTTCMLRSTLTFSLRMSSASRLTCGRGQGRGGWGWLGRGKLWRGSAPCCARPWPPQAAAR